MRLRIVSWNLAGNARNWGHAARVAVEGGQLGIVAAQEARPPGAGILPITQPATDDPAAWSIQVPPGPAPGTPSRTFSSALGCSDAARFRPVPLVPLAQQPYDRTGPRRLGVSHPGQLAVAEFDTGGEDPLVVVSMYGLWDRLEDEAGGHLYAEASLHRAISDLLPLLQADSRPRVIVTGDWNIWRGYGGGVWTGRYQTVFDRLSAYGFDLVGPKPDQDRGPLERCPCGPAPDCQHVRTYLHQRNPQNRPLQTDFVFASTAVSACITACTAIDEDWVWEVSDHTPVVVDVET